MPRATVDKEPKRFELQSILEGYVVLAPMSFGEVLHRRDVATKMGVEQAKGKRDARVSIESMQTETTWYEFKTTIKEHNLEDASGRTLNFNNIQDFSSLDPVVAAEIEKLISDMNALGDAEALFPGDQSLSGSEQGT